MMQTGTYEELLASSSSFRRLLEHIHQQEREQHTPPLDLKQRRMTRCVIFAEDNHESVPLMGSQNIETKEEGSVKWHVYISYLRAGAGLIFGVLLLVLIFGLREATSVFNSWWLAKWSNDEGYRHRQLTNCTKIVNEKLNMIRSMNGTEWNQYRNKRFYYYCGESIPKMSLLYLILSFFFLGIALVLSILSFVRVITIKAIFLNSGLILHNK